MYDLLLLPKVVDFVLKWKKKSKNRKVKEIGMSQCIKTTCATHKCKNVMGCRIVFI